MSRYAIDATPLLLRSAGIKNYLHHLISHLAAERGGDEILVYPFLDLPGALDHDRSVAGRAGTAWRILSLYLSRLGVPLIDWAYGERCDLFHASLHVNHPPKRPRLTATVYDMTCWLVPETHTRANVRATQEFGDAVMRRADGLIAISEATKRDAIRILGIDDQTIRVIYPGVIDAFFGAGPEEVERATQAYRLKKPYLLYVGALEPRKNIGRLLDAWELLPRDIREEYELVAAGQMGWHSEALRARLAEPGKGWRYPGYVEESLLPGLTAGGEVTV